jgi:hypothetical protein
VGPVAVPEATTRVVGRDSVPAGAGIPVAALVLPDDVSVWYGSADGPAVPGVSVRCVPGAMLVAEAGELVSQSKVTVVSADETWVSVLAFTVFVSVFAEGYWEDRAPVPVSFAMTELSVLGVSSTVMV